MTDRRLEEKPACHTKSAPFPTEITCPHCRAGVEMWSDETESTCGKCGKAVQKTEAG